MKNPRLYVNGKFTRIVNPVSVSITQNITPLSTATMVLPQDENLPARSWVELFTPYGSAGMFRVRTPHDAYGQETTTAELEHMISEVGDYLVKEEIKEMMAADAAMKKVFSYYKGGKWKLGSVSALGSGKIACDVNYDRVLDAMLAILEQKPDCMMKFDFTTPPWTVSIAKKGTTVAAEGRLARNITSAAISYDDTELCTRVWYQTFKKTGGNITPEWKSKDADTKSKYGIIENTVGTSSDMTTEEINQTVNTYLAEHKEPRVNISIQADELSQITGESMDKFLVGNLMRLALPDYNLTVEETITSVVWNDIYNNPRAVTVNLGKEEDTVVTFLHNLDNHGSGGGGGGKAQKEQESQFAEYTTTLEQGIYDINLNATHWEDTNSILTQAGMKLNSKGVLIYASDRPNHIGSKINVQADRIDLVVQGQGEDKKLNSAKIVMGLNKYTEGGGSYIKLKADTVELSGYVTMKKFEAQAAKIDDLITGRTTASTLACSTLHATTFYLNNNLVRLKRVKDGDGEFISLWGIP